MHWEWLIRGVEFVIVSGLAWRINRTLNRSYDLLQEYPLHRHIGGNKIIYPRGMEPDKPEVNDDVILTAKGRA